ncbi:MAG: hypothetical protein IT369_14695 [Candidatus Latescibacteria bacterium]|nr:hypothetical protein [Candidatus Latescibacterota bacterium]
MLNRQSLGATANAVNTALLLDQPITRRQAAEVAAFIAGRQGLPGNYGGLFAPIEGELSAPYRLFTGDPALTGAAARHILGEEALRLLKVLGVEARAVRQALGKAQEAFAAQLEQVQERRGGKGTYCCGKCTVAYWRTLSTHWLPDAEARLHAGMVALKQARQQGQWRRYPLYYTALCLNELPRDLALAERRYARPHCEAALGRLKRSSAHFEQHSAILEGLLAAA